MRLRTLGKTGIGIAPLVLGGNVFGWTADKATSFAILDAFLDAGFNAIDTADYYNRNAPGLQGGESETIIGEWMADRGVRDRVILISKAGLDMGDGTSGLGRDHLPGACEASLRRLRTDHIDIYMAHLADPKTPLATSFAIFDELIAAGKVGHAGCSNYSAEQLAEAFAIDGGRYAVVEPHYNLADRDRYEGTLEPLCVAAEVGVLAYYALAAGFLTGKYRRRADIADSARGYVLDRYMNPEKLSLLDRLDEVARRHGATPAQVALAWLMTRPSITAPIASATSVKQLGEILRSVDLALGEEDLAILDGIN